MRLSGSPWRIEDLRDAASPEVQEIVSKRFFGKKKKGEITPHTDYYPYILRVLVEMGGGGKTKAVLDWVGELMKGVLVQRGTSGGKVIGVWGKQHQDARPFETGEHAGSHKSWVANRRHGVSRCYYEHLLASMRQANNQNPCKFRGFEGFKLLGNPNRFSSDCPRMAIWVPSKVGHVRFLKTSKSDMSDSKNPQSRTCPIPENPKVGHVRLRSGKFLKLFFVDLSRVCGLSSRKNRQKSDMSD